MDKLIKDALMVFSSKGMCVALFHDDREEGLGYYVDFIGTNMNEGSGCVFYSDDLNAAMSFAKNFSENYSYEEAMNLDYDYEF